MAPMGFCNNGTYTLIEYLKIIFCPIQSFCLATIIFHDQRNSLWRQKKRFLLQELFFSSISKNRFLLTSQKINKIGHHYLALFHQKRHITKLQKLIKRCLQLSKSFYFFLNCQKQSKHRNKFNFNSGEQDTIEFQKS